MKRIAAVILVLSMAVSLCGCSMFFAEFDDEYVTVDNFKLCVNETTKECFVCEYIPQWGQDNRTVVIPEEYNGIPVTAIGGTFELKTPAPFFINLEVLYENSENTTSSSVSSDSSVKTVLVEYTIEIGKNIEKIESVSMDSYRLRMEYDGSVILYQPVAYIKCSEENPNFYSLEGKLYKKGSDEPVTLFPYYYIVEN